MLEIILFTIATIAFFVWMFSYSYSKISCISFCLFAIALITGIIVFILGITVPALRGAESTEVVETVESEKEIISFDSKMQTDIAAEGEFSGTILVSQGTYNLENKTYMRYSMYVKTNKGAEWKSYTTEKQKIYIDEYKEGERKTPTIEVKKQQQKRTYTKVPNKWFSLTQYLDYKHTEDHISIFDTDNKWIVIHVPEGTISNEFQIKQ